MSEAFKVDDDEKPKARLHGMLVEEVSIVDRAANRKRFLVVKRDESMAAELKSDGNGNLITSDDESSKVAKGDESGDESSVSSSAAEGSDKEPATADADAAAARAAAVKAFSDASRQLAEVLKAGEIAATDAELANQVRAAVNLVGSVVESGEAATRGNMSDEQSQIEKAGARMKRDRLDRFQKAVEQLQLLLKEFVPADDMAKAARNVARVSEANDVSGKILGAIEALTERVENIAKRQAEADAKRAETDARVEKIATGGAQSNALPVDRVRKAADDHVAWPMDMNRPIDRESVTKDTSFFD